MKLYQLDIAMNNLMDKYSQNQTTERENAFLINITNDLIELLHEQGIKLNIDKKVKSDSFEDSIANGWIYG